ncbi:MAG: putative TNF receptor-associated factor 4-like [Hyperionvirus sp.]|uniref:Putative TNF receptor-associated factor 4-like n=1 Tax=Hyperionvirus sp. TaxID=2487770 RepID=A0A3G5A6A3_9VIRU|nr:MAG: putative TNF receptor-associated factor 4-like [Hyperionvirus sp.]
MAEPAAASAAVPAAAAPMPGTLEAKGSGNEAITDRSVIPTLFTAAVLTDYICGICNRVPIRPVNPKCCGQISCKECIEEKVSPEEKCPYCGLECKAANIPPSPFVTTKIGGLTWRCPLQCGHSGLFGREGVRVDEHKKICPLVMMKCPDCDDVMNRRELALHRPTELTECVKKPIYCELCDVKVKPTEWDEHEDGRKHKQSVKKGMAKIIAGQKAIIDELKGVKDENAALKSEMDTVKRNVTVTQRECEEKIGAAKAEIEQRMAELRAHSLAQFCEFEVAKWSEVKESALFSTATPLKAWGHEWWLKVERGCDGRIGLYLCCGESDKPGVFPMHVDYQLMVRKRNDDLGVCASVVFRTEYGKEKAWGLSKFTTIELIEKEGAYSRTEDKITFGCRIVPVKNLRWGDHARPAAAAAGTR